MREQILECIKKNVNAENEITEDTPIVDLNIDSIKMIYLLIEVEKQFEIEIDDSNLNYKNYTCIKDLIDMIEEQIGNAGSAE